MESLVERSSTLNDLLGSLIERGARMVDWSGGETLATRPLGDLAADLLSSRGEASGLAIAEALLDRFEALSREERRAFFSELRERFDPDPKALVAAADAYAESETPEALATLLSAAEPPRQELFRRLNQAPDGTRRLVAMREKLLPEVKKAPELAPLDADLEHLFVSWFNRGFLVMRPIDWRTPAHLLEKIITYEAVHEIDSWDELRRRIEPPDRRCFAFFHPAMPDEPLIFVEVALTGEISDSIQEVLRPDRAPLAAEDATTAVFYSISNCQRGLAGVSFGAFLIKQVAADLARALPNLKTYVTLSPVPGFVAWLEREAARTPGGAAEEALTRLAEPGWVDLPERTAPLKPLLLGLAARYFLEAKRPDGRPVDPVARFHLGNGAELHRLNWLGDVSAKGLRRAGGLMVNYRYDLDAIEARHEAYQAGREIAAARGVRALLPSGEGKGRKGER